MKIILGIGNPGAKYAGTRHNVGYMVLDRLAEKHGLPQWRNRFHSLATEGMMCGEKTLLLKPETYVNDSGRALRAALDWWQTALEDVLVVADDLNLPLGRLRIRPGGSSGGHKGLESIAQHMAGMDVPRLRIGIGAAPPGRAKDYVLSMFASAEKTVMNETLQRAMRAVEVWLESGIGRCQNEFNSDPGDEKQP